ncbi:Lrp/AsnC family transcriptional regulator [Diaminobutyricimonas sp. TR449]|uniref:Lrp/AsnC family transcriptional regulator n=1 Tax=Diaminobutyricimonas sp. TR449 TaxID=2708076 RepID=UPI001AB03304|nr:Lrp/AsnC family transcriptional regulator [Diaminobutyricimonas sp. TR449]
MAVQLDETDRKIVAELQKDGRASIRAIAAAVLISRANAYARVNRLVESGVITGFTAKVDPVKLGQTASAYVMLRVEQESWQSLRVKLSEIPAVQHFALLGGDMDVALLVRAADIAELRQLVLTELQAIPEVLGTRTWIIFEDHDTR